MRVVRLLVYEGPENVIETVLGRSTADGLTPYGAYSNTDAYTIRAVTLRGGFFRRTRAMLSALFYRTGEREQRVAEVVGRLKK